jgi:hypothetical protein
MAVVKTTVIASSNPHELQTERERFILTPEIWCR